MDCSGVRALHESCQPITKLLSMSPAGHFKWVNRDSWVAAECYKDNKPCQNRLRKGSYFPTNQNRSRAHAVSFRHEDSRASIIIVIFESLDWSLGFPTIYHSLMQFHGNRHEILKLSGFHAANMLYTYQITKLVSLLSTHMNQD
ncbi:hypothetical protein KP509_38G035200 [Ceratopteris richardii]|uniref:Uncharacterized protein n=1 Tax=Ceratopteris richardii TaxID=49495 RepID=A0A8T2Q3Q8_CERRI|nr:hypothetical protein KP509_38G035200 [Ceratopteris richardii]